MEKVSAEFKSSLQPIAKVIVSCRGKNGLNNALAVAYCCNCSYDPPMVMVGIVPSRHSHHMIKESGCLVVNLVTEDNKELFDYVGSNSGRDVDKFKEANIKHSEGATVNAPVLVDCPVNIECTVENSIITGSHEMFACKIEYVHAQKELLNEDGTVDLSKSY